MTYDPSFLLLNLFVALFDSILPLFVMIATGLCSRYCLKFREREVIVRKRRTRFERKEAKRSARRSVL
jgi:hypothetical protein